MNVLTVAVPPALAERLERAAAAYEIPLELMCRAVLNDFVKELDADPRSKTHHRRPLELVEGGAS